MQVVASASGIVASKSEEAKESFHAVIFEEQRRTGRDATCEHPWSSKAWKTKAIAKMQGYDNYIDQCQYKLKLPDDSGSEAVVRPVKKPTCFRTSGPVI